MNKEYKTFEELKEELGDKFEEFMYKVNIELLEKVNQLETNRDEAIEYLRYALDEEKETPSKHNDWRLDLLEIIGRSVSNE